jgi:putative DNA primase/helicase
VTARKLRVAQTEDEPQSSDSPEKWRTGKQIKKGVLTWMIPNLLIDGTLAVLEGAKGVSKSTWCAHLAAAITNGTPFFGRKKSAPGSVLWLPGEERIDNEIMPRLKVAGANIQKMVFPPEDENGNLRRYTLPANVPQIQAVVEHYGVKLVIIDPLSSHVPADMSLGVDQVIHQILDPVAAMANTMDAVVLLTRNLTKDKFADRINQGLGGAGVGGVARSVIVIDWPNRKLTRRVMRLVAGNHAGESPVIEYSLARAKGGALLEDVKFLSATEDDEELDALASDERDEATDCEVLIRRLVKTERVPFSTIWSEAQSAGISLRTLRRTKVRLLVKSYRVGSSSPPHWEWGPPIGGW